MNEEALPVTGVHDSGVQLQTGNALHLKTSNRYRSPSSGICTAMLPDNGTPKTLH